MSPWILVGALALLYFNQHGHQPGVNPQGVATPGGPPPQPGAKKTPPAPSILSDPSNPDAWIAAANANRQQIGDAAVDVMDLIRGDSASGQGPNPATNPALASGAGYEGAETPLSSDDSTPQQDAARSWSADLEQDAPAPDPASWNFDSPEPFGRQTGDPNLDVFLA